MLGQMLLLVEDEKGIGFELVDDLFFNGLNI